jgi:chorismate mutase/prephenate dehydratase
VSKKQSSPQKNSAAKRKPTIGQLRSSIQRIDRQLVRQCHDRARLVQQLKQLSTADALRACETSEVQQKLGPAVARLGPLPDSSIHAILREVTSAARAHVAPLKAAYLGPPYTFTHLAAVEQFGESAELVPVSTISAVFEEVHQHQVQRGVVPLENSTDGRIVDTLEMFAKVPVKICGEVRLKIHHHLLGKCPRADVTEVYSKPQAISQCRNWLARHLPQARVHEITSTAAAAELASTRSGVAAIASRQAGEHHGLQLIAAAIEDNQNNITRFAIIGDEPAPRSGNDKTALMFEVAHAPGALADVMVIFKRSRLNLTWIESFPLPGGINEYIFFVEFEGHPTEARSRRALALVKNKVVRLEILGAYEKKEPVE